MASRTVPLHWDMDMKLRMESVPNGYDILESMYKSMDIRLTCCRKVYEHFEFEKGQPYTNGICSAGIKILLKFIRKFVEKHVARFRTDPHHLNPSTTSHKLKPNLTL